MYSHTRTSESALDTIIFFMMLMTSCNETFGGGDSEGEAVVVLYEAQYLFPEALLW